MDRSCRMRPRRKRKSGHAGSCANGDWTASGLSVDVDKSAKSLSSFRDILDTHKRRQACSHSLFAPASRHSSQQFFFSSMEDPRAAPARTPLVAISAPAVDVITRQGCPFRSDRTRRPVRGGDFLLDRRGSDRGRRGRVLSTHRGRQRGRR